MIIHLSIWYPVVMTQEDKDAIYGRAKREEKEAREHLAFVQQKISLLSATLGNFSNLLHSNPQLIHVDGEKFVVPSPLEPSSKLQQFSKADFDGEKIAVLLRESEEARIQCQNTERKVKELGG
jgi:hypothetical protein